ncbi:MAG TPA: hypothetical protein VL490_10545 [Mucilaginibacter sp.]|jgi:hypothetical protein|nr:hypothetical protein [Mucilaginibacter sp.]
MYIAYSALQPTSASPITGDTPQDEQADIRLKAYQAICNKYNKEIAAIQKYLPGWAPAYPGK